MKKVLGTRLDKNRYDPRSKHNQQKKELSDRQRSWGVWGDALSPSVGALKRKFLDSREHLDWLKIDLNAAEIIIAQYYKRTKR